MASKILQTSLGVTVPYRICSVVFHLFLHYSPIKCCHFNIRYISNICYQNGL